MSVADQKIKLLILYEILKLKSAQDEPMTTAVLCKELEECGIQCDRRTLARDIKVLNDYDYEVMETTIGHSKAYYVDDRVFSISELRILIDAIQAASFITNKKSEEIIGKIVMLGGKFNAKMLEENMVVFNTKKHSNESILYNVDELERALLTNKKVSFHYFKLNEKAEKVYSKNKEKYIVNPVALIYLEDNYYLVTYNEKYQGPTNYRLDRMDNVEMLDEEIHETTYSYRNDITGYTEKIFKMYQGEEVEVVLSFKEEVINPFFDRFGEGVEIKKITDPNGEIWYESKVTIQDSPTFYAWLFTFTTKIKIIEPIAIQNKYKEQLSSIIEEYSK